MFLCDPMDCSPWGCSAHGIFRQEHRSRPKSLALAGEFFTTDSPEKQFLPLRKKKGTLPLFPLLLSLILGSQVLTSFLASQVFCVSSSCPLLPKPLTFWISPSFHTHLIQELLPDLCTPSSPVLTPWNSFSCPAPSPEGPGLSSHLHGEPQETGLRAQVLKLGIQATTGRDFSRTLLPHNLDSVLSQLFWILAKCKRDVPSSSRGWTGSGGWSGEMLLSTSAVEHYGSLLFQSGRSEASDVTGHSNLATSLKKNTS